jgi:nicotinate phosphoribosyltransferase
VRLDSGDLLEQAHRVRHQLDALGAHDAAIVVTSDLDEFAIAALAAAPVDAYGVGTQLVTGSGAPTASLVYKMVARQDDDGNWVDVEKHSVDKGGAGGRKHAVRRRRAGTAVAECLAVSGRPLPGDDDRPLQVALVREGEVVGREPLAAARDRHLRCRSELPPPARQMSQGDPVIPTVVESTIAGAPA